MSHNLEIIDGEASFISAGDDVAGGGRGWHLLGKLKKKGYATLKEMIHGANLHKTYFKVPLTALITPDMEIMVDGMPYPVKPGRAMVEGKVAVCRLHPVTDELQVISVVGEDHKVWQPYDSFAFVQRLLDTNQAIGVTAGALNEGKQPFCCFKLPGHMMVGGVDRVDLYLGMVDSFDGSRKLTVAATPVRFECANTVTLGLRQAVRVWTLKHTKGAELDEDKAREALDLSNKYAEAFVSAAETMLKRRLSNRKFEQIIEQEFGPGENPSQRAAALWETKRSALMASWGSPNLGNVKNTAWAGWNAVVEYLDWSMPVRGVGDSPVEQNRARLQRSFDAAVREGGDGTKSISDVKYTIQQTLLAATAR